MSINRHSSQNASGRYIDYLDPQPDQFTLDDIVRGLSREHRFNGQTKFAYSVAQHSVLVSLLVPKEYALAALVHDGSEAFMRDICTPLKNLLPDYQRIERGVQGAVHAYFGLPRQLPKDMEEQIKIADAAMAATERHQLMPQDDRVWPGLTITPLDLRLRPMNESKARVYFERRLVSIMEDAPFLANIDLWVAQHDEWAARQEDAPTSVDMLEDEANVQARPRQRSAA